MRKAKVTPMEQAAAIIALSERLQQKCRKVRDRETIADLRLATRYLRALAASGIAEEADAETNSRRKAQLERKFLQLYCEFLRWN